MCVRLFRAELSTEGLISASKKLSDAADSSVSAARISAVYHCDASVVVLSFLTNQRREAITKI